MTRHRRRHERSRGRSILWALLIVLAITIGVQLLYPRNRALPRARLDGTSVAFASRDSLTQQFTGDENEPLTLNSGIYKEEVPLKGVGFTVKPQETADNFLEYPLVMRLVPFSMLFMQRGTAEYALDRDASQVELFTEQLPARADTKPSNATVVVQNGDFAVQDSVDGKTHHSDQLAEQFRTMPIYSNRTLVLVADSTPANAKTDEAKQAKESAEAKVGEVFTVSFDGTSKELGRDVTAHWITFTPDESRGAIDLSNNSLAVTNTLATLSDNVYIEDNSLVIIDGAQPKEAGEKVINMTRSLSEVEQALDSNQQSAEIVTAEVTAAMPIQRVYSRTSKGLQAALDFWMSDKRASYGVMIMTLDGSIEASHGADTKFIAASLYKPFVVSEIYKLVAEGKLSMDEATSEGRPVKVCIDEAMRISDNPCAVALGDIVGWSKVDDHLHSLGYTNTTLDMYDLQTTARDNVKWLQDLAAYKHSTRENTDHLIDVMKRQIYRDGIPSGSRHQTANKVGFLESYNHDAAIVYSPDGAYAIAILSKSSNYSAISDLAELVDSVLTQN